MTRSFHYKQQSYACGPAALRMLIQTLINKDPSEERLIDLLASSAQQGTPLSAFASKLPHLLQTHCEHYAIDNHFKLIIQQNSCATELEHLQNQGYEILINYSKPNGQAHWALLDSVSKHFISLMDPDFGPQTRYLWSEFNWQGGSPVKPTKQALVAVSYSTSS